MDRVNKVLVTGGAGFIGSHLCEKLLDGGAAVVSLDNFNPYYDPSLKKKNIAAAISKYPERFISIEGDIRDAETVNRIFREHQPGSVVHLAAMAGVRPSIQDPGLYVDVNLKGTQILLDACRNTGIRNFLFASSSSVYGNNEKVPFSETDNVDYPISPYAATKKAGELLCHSYAHLFGMKICCLRFFTVYGPRQRPDLAIRKFAALLMADEEIPFFGGGNTKRDYTYVDDIIDGVTKALAWNESRPEKSFEIFNLGESRTVSLSEMITCLEKATGRKAKLKKMPMQPGDVDKTYADISKAKKILRYDPRTEFEEGIDKFMLWLNQTEAVHERK